MSTTPAVQRMDLARPLLVFSRLPIPGLSTALMRSFGWEPCWVSTERDCRVATAAQPHISTALVYPDTEDKWLRQMEAAFSRFPQYIQIIAIVDHDRMRDPRLRRFVAQFCFDYHSLPLNLSRLFYSLGHACGVAIIGDGCGDLYPLDTMVGGSKAMLALFGQIRKVATVDAPVLITGETGTGKELAALAIHEHSARAHKPFVAINCGSIPEQLIQSELFGHEKGAFTGAHERKIGKIEAAAGGTLFLDEIGDCPLAVQVSLLRFLQEQCFERVGSTQSLQADVRIIAATHVDLEAAAKQGQFREDLYYRLNVLRLQVPALRERGGDAPLLAHYFLQHFAHEKNPHIKGIGQAALGAISTYSWPGNVRELINRMRRAMVMSDHAHISIEDLGLPEQDPVFLTRLDQAREKAEREAIIVAIHASGRNLSEAARTLDIARVTLYRLMDKYVIDV
ncbi:MAG: sigma-54 interaction domain-containing protein [Acidithiobacillus sp.]